MDYQVFVRENEANYFLMCLCALLIIGVICVLCLLFFRNPPKPLNNGQFQYPWLMNNQQNNQYSSQQ